MGKFIDLTGQRFGKLTVIERIENDKYGKSRWLCKCDCANFVFRNGWDLKSGVSTHCGCENSHVVDLTGMRFGRLVVIEKAETPLGIKNRSQYWLCRCDCNKEKVINGNVLMRGKSNSCGCKKIEKSHEYIDITGERFGRLIVIKLDHINKRGTYWLCKCDCGSNPKVISGRGMRKGLIVSCGCYQKERQKEANKIGFAEASFNVIYNEYKKRSEKNGRSFSLSVEYFKKLINSNCTYCGEPPSNKKICRGNGDYVYSGIDRLDSCKGYEEENVVSCCKICNFMKKTMGQQEFLDHIEKIHNYQKEKNEAK